MIAQKIWTYEINNSSLLIDQSFSLTKLSIVLMSGTGTITGTEICGGIPSSTINLVAGMPVLVTGDGSTPIADYLIATTGVVALIGVK